MELHHLRRPWLAIRLPILLTGLISAPWAAAQTFVDVTASAGVTLQHQSSQTITDIADAGNNAITPITGMHQTAQLMSSWLSAGIAAGDYDDDGWVDMFVIGGDAGQSRLYRNLGDGSFEDKTGASGLGALTGWIAGAVFADVEGDGDLDLFLGGALGEPPRLLIQNQVDGEPQFSDHFAAAFPGYQIDRAPNTWGANFGDINNDGCLDVFLPHSMTPLGPSPSWKTAAGSTQHLWQGDCTGVFQDISISSGIAAIFDAETFPNDGRDQSFAGLFVDINEDGLNDLLIAGDVGSSLVLLNQGNSQFIDITDRQIIDDRNAMGTDVGDLNLDGHLDWFSSNISNLGGSPFGNRLYYGDGQGGFDNVSETTGVVEGLWGWGACFLDVNLDRYPDIFHVNGFYFGNNTNPNTPDGRFDNTPAMMFVSSQGNAFTEMAETLGIGDIGEGRGLACFDYDRDGDLDIAISNYKGSFKLYRNDLPESQRHYLSLKLNSDDRNTEALGAWVSIASENSDDSDQVLTQQIKAGSHFVSASPAELHFGLGDWQGPLSININWPSGVVQNISGVMIDQHLVMNEPTDRILRTGFE